MLASHHLNMAVLPVVLFAVLLSSPFLQVCATGSPAEANPWKYTPYHNEVRAQHGLPPLEWDWGLAKYANNWAQKLAKDCKMVHSMGPYGENLFWGGGLAWTPVDAVKLWASEIKYYNYTDNSCVPGQMCGHYTQVVWRNTQRVGCARVVCAAGDGLIMQCNYDPPGNYIGQKPY